MLSLATSESERNTYSDYPAYQLSTLVIHHWVIVRSHMRFLWKHAAGFHRRNSKYSRKPSGDLDRSEADFCRRKSSPLAHSIADPCCICIDDAPEFPNIWRHLLVSKNNQHLVDIVVFSRHFRAGELAETLHVATKLLKSLEVCSCYGRRWTVHLATAAVTVTPVVRLFLYARHG